MICLLLNNRKALGTNAKGFREGPLTGYGAEQIDLLRTFHGIGAEQ